MYEPVLDILIFTLFVPSFGRRIIVNSIFPLSGVNLKAFESDGLATISHDGFKIKDMGRLLIRNIAINFDGYIERKEDKAKYSRTV